MKHTFASSSRHPASCRPFLVILGSCVVSEETSKDTCNAKYFRAKGNTLQYWPFSFCQDFYPEGGFFSERRLFPCS
jgi:hypothetical protein